MFNIMEFDLPNDQGRYDMNRGKNYMILESINSMPAKVVHVFDLRFDSFKIGRSVETDMKIADISVSRTHSFFKIEDRQLFVEDNGSKFGTLVKIQRPLAVLRSKTDGSSLSTLLQVGRTLLYLNLKTAKQVKWNFGRQVKATRRD
jgi:pSer/pThr/pTyr-binding forkhead associated (FHA) protein